MELGHLWKDELKIGAAELDSQHYQMFYHGDELLYMIHNKEATPEKLKEMIEYFSSYSEYHFSEEEEYQIVNNYLGYEQHKKAHEAFTNTMQYYKRALEKGYSDRLASNFCATVIQWLTTHVTQCDAKIVENLPMEVDNRYENSERFIRSVIEEFFETTGGIQIKDMKRMVYRGGVDGDIIVRTEVEGMGNHLFYFGLESDLAQELFLRIAEENLYDVNDLDQFEKDTFMEIGETIATYVLVNMLDEDFESFSYKNSITTVDAEEIVFQIKKSAIMCVETPYGNMDILYCCD